MKNNRVVEDIEEEKKGCEVEILPNKSLHLTAIPLHYRVGGEI